MGRAGRYITSKSLSQRMDFATGKLMEALECGHEVATPLTSLGQPYTPGVNRCCRECTKIADRPLPAPVRTDEALAAAAAKAGVEFQAFPIAHELSGVYCLLRNGRVMYIGQSRNVLARIGTHVKAFRKKFNAVKIAMVPRSRLDEVEGALIRALRPPLNKSIPGEHSPHFPQHPESGLVVSPEETGGVPC